MKICSMDNIHYIQELLIIKKIWTYSCLDYFIIGKLHIENKISWIFNKAGVSWVKNKAFCSKDMGAAHGAQNTNNMVFYF